MSIRFGITNKVDTATLTATTAATGYNKEYVKDNLLTLQYKANDNSGDEYIKANFGSAQSIDTIGIAGHTLGSAGPLAAITLQSSPDDAAWTTRATFTPTSDDTFIIHFASVSVQYWKIALPAYTAAPAIGRWFLGAYYQPSKAINCDYKRTMIDMSAASRTGSGAKFVDKRAKYWTNEFAIGPVSGAALATMRTNLYNIGISDRVWLNFNPGANGDVTYRPDALFGCMAQPWSEVCVSYDLFTCQFAFEEDL